MRTQKLILKSTDLKPLKAILHFYKHFQAFTVKCLLLRNQSYKRLLDLLLGDVTIE